MNYFDFLNRVIDDGIEAAKADYVEPEDKKKLDGSLEGFEACRNKLPMELSDLLISSHRETEKALQESFPDYWQIRCREVEIEWVSNVVSAALSRSAGLLIIPPTARGMTKALSILSDGLLIVFNEEPV